MRPRPISDGSFARRYAVSIRALLVAAALCAPLPASPSALASDPLPLQEQAAFQQAVDVVAPSVVQIETIGGNVAADASLSPTGPTTGVVVSSDGLVITSSFTFLQQPASVLVTDPAGQRYGARVLASDPSRMLTLLAVSGAQGWQVPRPAPRDSVRVGQWSIAVGRSLDAQRPNLSVGIVSARDRVWGKALQTDAKISPHNYGGPLIDLQGRVLGLLVPLSPDAPGTLSGAEWYDSGIGFAIPWETVLTLVPRLALGKDLLPGKAGFRLRGSDVLTEIPVVSQVRPNSPAFHAGLRAGDQILAVDGQPVRRQVDVRQALESHFAGESLRLVALRGEQRLEFDLPLVDHLVPYRRPLLGIWPVRGTETPATGVALRGVLPNSPAAAAGITLLDTITSCDGQSCTHASRLAELLAAKLPSASVRLTLRQGDKERTADVLLAEQPDLLGLEPPPQPPLASAPAEPLPERGQVQLNAPQFRRPCLALVPQNYDPRRPPGLVVWFHGREGLAEKDVAAVWHDWCERHSLVLVLPRAQAEVQWFPPDLFQARLIVQHVQKTYQIDPARIVTWGEDEGGRVAQAMALAMRDTFRGAIVLGTSLAPHVPDNEPSQPLAWLVGATGAAPQPLPMNDAPRDNVERWRKAGFPVSVLPAETPQPAASSAASEPIGRWINALDRL